MLFNTTQIEWTCRECEKQEVTPIKVYYMLVGVEFMHSIQYLSINDLTKLANIVEPKTKGQFRTFPVTHGMDHRVIGIGWTHIEHAINNLLTAIGGYHILPEDAYNEFERIHPFVDGNGRVGAIIYNWMKQSLFNPLPPPEFKEEIMKNFRGQFLEVFGNTKNPLKFNKRT